MKGIKILSVEHKVALYADDTFFLLSNPSQSLIKLCDWFDKFSEVSGNKTNDQKLIIWGFGIFEQLGGRIRGLNIWGYISIKMCQSWLI